MANIAGLAEGDGVYSPLPLFHSSSLFTGLSAALNAGVPFGTRSRFSASGTLADVRRMDASLLTYTGKILNHVLAVPPAPNDGTNPLRLAIGNEASEADIRAFSVRFACDVRDSYGSTEGMIIIRRDATMPPGALGRADEGIVVVDPATGLECPVPDEPVGDRVMAALELTHPDDFDAKAFDAFLADQIDLGPKWLPSFVRISAGLPKLASMKLDRSRLRREAWEAPDVYLRRGRAAPLEALAAGDADDLRRLLP